MIDGKKLSKLLIKKNITSENLSNILATYGIKLGVESIKKYRTNNVNIPSKTVSALADILDITEQELYENYEKQKEIIVKNELKKNPLKYSQTLNAITNDNIITLPYYEDNYACMGNGVQNFSRPTNPISFDKLFLRAKLGNIKFDNLHIINAIGNSMEPTISSGELLFINPYENENTIINGAIYVFDYYGDIFIKRIVRNPKTGEVVLHSDNKEENPPITIEKADEDNCKTLGRVVAHFNWL